MIVTYAGVGSVKFRGSILGNISRSYKSEHRVTTYTYESQDLDITDTHTWSVGITDRNVGSGTSSWDGFDIGPHRRTGSSWWSEERWYFGSSQNNDTLGYKEIKIEAIRGDGTNGGGQPGSNEDLEVVYWLGGSHSTTLIGTILAHDSPDGTTGTVEKTFTLPPEARTDQGVFIKIRVYSNNGDYGIKKVTMVADEAILPQLEIPHPVTTFVPGTTLQFYYLDFGSIGESPINPIDHGAISVLAYNDSNYDWGYITITSRISPYGDFKLSSITQWTVHKAWVGTGQIFEHGRGRTRLVAPWIVTGTIRLDGAASTFYVPSVATQGILPLRSNTTVLTTKHEQGSGTLSAFSGAAEATTNVAQPSSYEESLVQISTVSAADINNDSNTTFTNCSYSPNGGTGNTFNDGFDIGSHIRIGTDATSGLTDITVREVSFNLDLIGIEKITLSAIRGNNYNGGEVPEGGEDLYIQFGSGSEIIIVGATDTSFNSLNTTADIDVPVSAKITNSPVRIYQKSFSYMSPPSHNVTGSVWDHYGVKSIELYALQGTGDPTVITTLFNVNGSAADSFHVNWNSYGTVGFSGQLVEKHTDHYVGYGSLPTFSGGADTLTKHYSLDSEEIFEYNDYGSITTTTNNYFDYGEIIEEGVPSTLTGFSDYEYIWQTFSRYPMGLFPIGGTASVVFTPSWIGSGTIKVYGHGIGKAKPKWNGYVRTKIQGAAKTNFSLLSIGSGTLFNFASADENRTFGWSTTGSIWSWSGAVEAITNVAPNLIPGVANVTAEDLNDPSKATLTNCGYWASGTGTGSGGGFDIGSHIRIGDDNGENSNYSTSLREVSFSLNLEGVERIRIYAIRGNGINGGEEPDSGEDLYIQFGTYQPAILVAQNDTSYDSLNTVDINIPAFARTSNFPVRIYQNTSWSGQVALYWDQFGIRSIELQDVVGDIPTVITTLFDITGLGKDSLTVNPPEEGTEIVLSGTAVEKYGPHYHGSGDLPNIGSLVERRTYHYSSTSDDIFEYGDYGSITTGNDYFDYGGIIEGGVPSTIIEFIDYEYIWRNFSNYAMGDITIGGDTHVTFTPSWNGSGTVRVGGTGRARIKPRWVAYVRTKIQGAAKTNFSLSHNGSGVLWNFSSGEESRTYGWQTTGSIWSWSGVAEVVGVNPPDITTLFNITGISPTAFTPNWNSQGTIPFTGTAVEKYGPHYHGSGVLYDFSEVKDSRVFDYNGSSIDWFEYRDYGSAAPPINQYFDCGHIELPQTVSGIPGNLHEADGIEDYQWIIAPDQDGTVYPFGGLHITGDAYAPFAFKMPTVFEYNKPADINITGFVVVFTPPTYYSYCLIGIDGAAAPVLTTSHYHGSGDLYALNGAAESITVVAADDPYHIITVSAADINNGPNTTITNCSYWPNGGTGNSTNDGFDIGSHIRIGTDVPSGLTDITVRRVEFDLDLRNVRRIKIHAIRGNDSNGGETPYGGFQQQYYNQDLLFRFGTPHFFFGSEIILVRANSQYEGGLFDTTFDSLNTVEVDVPESARIANSPVRIFQNYFAKWSYQGPDGWIMGSMWDHYGVKSIDLYQYTKASDIIIGGAAKTNFSLLQVGSGVIFSGGFVGEATTWKIPPTRDADILLGGTRQSEKTAAAEVGTGSLYAIGSAVESSLTSITPAGSLCRIGGVVDESFTPTSYIGSGVIFSGGFIGESTTWKIPPSRDADILVGGTRQSEKISAAEVGTGILYGLSGASVNTSITSISGGLFQIDGVGVVRTSDAEQGSGVIFSGGFGGEATTWKIPPTRDADILLGSAAKTNFSLLHVGSGDLSAIGGAAESITVVAAHYTPSVPLDITTISAADINNDPNTTIWNCAYWANSGTGTTATDGFNIGSHIRIGDHNGENSSSGRREVELELDLRNVERITIHAIRGNGSNGGESPDDDEHLYIKFGNDQPAILVAYNDTSFDSLNTVDVNVPEFARVKNSQILIVQYNFTSTYGIYDHYGVKSIDLHQYTFTSTTPVGALYRIGGVVNERTANITEGSGVIFSGGFIGEATTWKIPPTRDADILLGSAAKTNFSLLQVGSGDLYAIGGAAESITVVAADYTHHITTVSAADINNDPNTTIWNCGYQASGTGIGSNGGFNIGPHILIGANSNRNHVNSDRVVELELDLRNVRRITVHAIRGNGINGGDSPDNNSVYMPPNSGTHLYIQFFSPLGNGQLAILVAYNDTSFDSLNTVDVNVPEWARIQNAQVLIAAYTDSSSGSDHYGVKSIDLHQYTFKANEPVGALYEIGGVVNERTVNIIPEGSGVIFSGGFGGEATTWKIPPTRDADIIIGSAAKTNFSLLHVGSGDLSALNGAAESRTVVAPYYTHHITTVSAADINNNPNTTMWNCGYWANSGTGVGSGGGFHIGSHILIGDINAENYSSTALREVEFDLDLRNVERITIHAIRGNGSNGGESPDDYEHLYIQFSSYNAIIVVHQNDTEFDSLNTFDINIPAFARTANFPVRFYQPTGAQSQIYAWDNFGIRSIDLHQYTFRANEPLGALYEIGGVVNERTVNIIPEGSGVIFSGGFGGEATTWKIPPTRDADILLGGTRQSEKTAAAEVGTGSLYAIGGAAESSLTSTTPTGPLYRIGGVVNERTTDAEQGSGVIFSGGFIGEATTWRIPPTRDADILVGSAAKTNFSLLHVGSGDLYAIGGAAESTTVVAAHYTPSVPLDIITISAADINNDPNTTLTNCAYWADSGTGTGPRGGFDIGSHIRFGDHNIVFSTEWGNPREVELELDLRNVERITVHAIRGSGINGGESPGGTDENLHIKFGNDQPTTLVAYNDASYNSLNTVDVNVPEWARVKNSQISIVQYNFSTGISTRGLYDHYGVKSIDLHQYTFTSTTPVGALYEIGGVGVVRTSDAEQGSGVIFSGGFIGEATTWKIPPSRDADIIIGGVVDESFTPAPYIGSGSLKNFSGASESLTVNPDERQLLFSFIGAIDTPLRTFAEFSSGTIPITGSAYYSLSDVYAGEGVIFSGGFGGESTTWKIPPMREAHILLGGFATERTSFNPPDITTNIHIFGEISDPLLTFAEQPEVRVEVSGVAHTVHVDVYGGEGVIFSGGFGGESTTWKIPPMREAHILLGGTRQSEKTAAAEVGTGRLYGLSGASVTTSINGYSGGLFTIFGSSAAAASISEIGDGIFSTFSGAAESTSSIPPTHQVLFSISGLSTYTITRNEIGDGNIWVDPSALVYYYIPKYPGYCHIKVAGEGYITRTRDWVGEGVIFSGGFSGEATTWKIPPSRDADILVGGTRQSEKTTTIEIGEGRLYGLSGASVTTSVTGISGGLFQIDGVGYITRTRDWVGTGVIFSNGFGGESTTIKLPPMREAHILFGGTRQSEKTTTIEIGEGRLYSLIGEAIGQYIPHWTGSGSVEIDGVGYITRTRDWVGEGVIFSGGFGGESTTWKIPPMREAHILLGGSRLAEKTTTIEIGEGRLYGLSGASVTTSVTGISGGLFQLDGIAYITRTRDFVGTGSLFGIDGAAESFTVVPPEQTALFEISGVLAEKTAVSEIGYGRLWGWGGSAEAIAFSPDEEQVLFYFVGAGVETVVFDTQHGFGRIHNTGEAVINVSYSHVGDGNLFSIVAGREAVAYDYVGIGTTQISGFAIERFVRAPYQGKTEVAINGDASIRVSYDQVGSGVIFSGGFGGEATTWKIPPTRDADILINGNSSNSITKDYIVDAETIDISGIADERFIRSTYYGDTEVVISAEAIESTVVTLTGECEVNLYGEVSGPILTYAERGTGSLWSWNRLDEKVAFAYDGYAVIKVFGKGNYNPPEGYHRAYGVIHITGHETKTILNKYTPPRTYGWIV